MNLNATLLGQMITFAIFVWFTMKFVWPPISKALEERRGTIAEGLAAAERGKSELEVALHKSQQILNDAKADASRLVKEANQRASQLVEDAKEQARQEGQRILLLAKEDIAEEEVVAREALRKHLSTIAVQGAERILQQRIDTEVQASLLQDLIDEI